MSVMKIMAKKWRMAKSVPKMKIEETAAKSYEKKCNDNQA